MVIDDEEFCLTATKTLLQKAGIDIQNQVDFLISGVEALSKLEEATAFGKQYKLILTDFNMPHMDGIETARRIRSFLTARKIL